MTQGFQDNKKKRYSCRPGGREKSLTLGKLDEKKKNLYLPIIMAVYVPSY